MDTSCSMAGKICLVTGATSGIGKETAMGLAKLGATVVVAGRNQRKCLGVIHSIKQKTHTEAHYLIADFSSPKQVRQLASNFQHRFPRLDVLVNNVGTYFMNRELNEEGIEMTFALNHLSYFLLTRLLLGHLKNSTSARIINVSSAAHQNTQMDFNNLQGERHYDRLEAYAKSKLANLLFTYALTERLSGAKVTVNALHPGEVATHLGSNNGWLRVTLRNLLRPKLLSPKEGAQTPLFLASSSTVSDLSGRYFVNCQPSPSSPASHDRLCGEQLWRVSENLLSLSPWS